MNRTGYRAVDRREFLVGALAAGMMLTLPAGVLAQAMAGAGDPSVDVVRRLMVLSSQNALARLGQPNGFLNSAVARFNLPILFVKRGAAPAGPLAQAAFRDTLIQRLNQFAEAGARGASPVVAEAARKLPIVEAGFILRGKGPTAATSAMRLEMGSGLVNALRGPLEQALITAQDPTIAQAIAALPGVTLADVAHAIALSADNGIWYEIGAAEVDIRTNPAGTGDAALIAALAASGPVTAPPPLAPPRP